MDCPNGHGPMTTGKKGWICEECDYKAAYPVTDSSATTLSSLLDRLPSPIAIPWHGFLGEINPVLRLHRLCDAAEITVRFLTITALGETRRGLGDAPLPDNLLQSLQPNIERPTFGRWWAMLRALSAAPADRSDLVIPELPTFVKEALAPLLDGTDVNHSLVALRNDIHHSGGTPLATAQRLLTEWTPRAKSLLGALTFLAEAELRFMQGDQTYPLTGPSPLSPPGRNGAGRVTLHRGDEALDLWPLCDYGPVLPDPNAARPGPMPSGPRVFLRADRDRLLFAALGVDPWQGESRDSLAGFRALFRLDQQKSPTASETPADFEQEIFADANALIGRLDDLKQAKAAIKEAQTGVLWIGGPGGMGKSYLMAKLAADYGNDPQKSCRLAWRFRAGDAARCSRLAFLRYAVELLSRWKPLQTEEAPPPTVDPAVLRQQLAELLDRAAALPARDPRAKPPRVLFFLDGLDEIERLDPDFVRLPFDLARPNVAWVCAGRPERTLPDVFAEDRCRHVFPGGLPPMGDNDIRALLLDETGPFKYALLAQDAEADGQVSNPTLAAIARQAQGLPLYVRLVITDIVSSHFAFADLTQKLPPSLSGYYDDQLQRLGLSDLSSLLPPLLTTITEAYAPLDEETLWLLMVRRKVLRNGETGRATLSRGLQALQSMIRPALTPGGALGYEPYHLTFREHVHASPHLSGQNAQTQDEFCALALDWAALPADHPARRYALQFGPQHLHDAQRWDDLYTLARNEAFLEAQADAFPTAPDTPLDTLRLALNAAIAQDDAARMGEFVITHARRLQATITETPRQALHNGSLTRAWQLADLYETEKSVLWHLLLAWELRDKGREESRAKTLQRIIKQDLPQLTSDWISPLLLLAADPDEPVFTLLSEKLSISVWHYIAVCKHLAKRGDIEGAKRFTEHLKDANRFHEALQAIVTAQVKAGDFRAAIDMVWTFKESHTDQALTSLMEIGEAAFQTGEKEVLRILFDYGGSVSHILRMYKDGWYKRLRKAELSLMREKIGPMTVREQELLKIFGPDEASSYQELEEACEAAQELQEPETQAAALLRIAQTAAKGKNTEQTKEIFNLASQSVGNLPTAFIRRIAVAQIQAGLITDALETERAELRVIEEHWQAINYPENMYRGKVELLRWGIGNALAEVGQFDMAQDLAWEINSPVLLAFTLQRLAVSQANAEMIEASKETFAEAVRAARHLPDDDVMCEIAMAQMQVGYRAAARQTFAMVFRGHKPSSKSYYQNSVLGAVAEAQLLNHEIMTALHTADKITGWRRNSLLGDIVEAQIKDGLLTAAQETIAYMSNSEEKFSYRDKALQHLAEAYIKAEDLEAAHTVITQISGADNKDWPLEELAEAYATRRDFKMAQKVAAEIQDNFWKKAALAAIAKVEAGSQEAGDTDTETTDAATDAVNHKTLPERETLAEVQAIEDIGARMRALWDHSLASAKVGDFKGALDALSLALQLTPEPEFLYMDLFDLINPNNPFGPLLKSFVDAGRGDDLLTCIQDSDQSGSSDDDSSRYEMIAFLLTETAAAQASVGHFDRAMSTVLSIRNAETRALGLKDIANAYRQAGNKSEAAQTLKLARQTALSVEWKGSRVSVLSEVAQEQARSGFGADAVETAYLITAEGREAALTDPYNDGGSPLTQIAEALIKDAGSFKRLLSYCAYAHDTARKMCALLAAVYPNQAAQIGDMVTGIPE